MNWLRRLSIAGVMLLIWSLLMMVAAVNLDNIMTGKPIMLEPRVVFFEIWKIPKAIQLWLLSSGLGLVYIISVLIGNFGLENRSAMQIIIPGIKIPKAAGQGQYGTAQFLNAQKYDSVWEKVYIVEDERIKELIKCGKEEGENI